MPTEVGVGDGDAELACNVVTSFDQQIVGTNSLQSVESTGSMFQGIYNPAYQDEGGQERGRDGAKKLADEIVLSPGTGEWRDSLVDGAAGGKGKRAGLGEGWGRVRCLPAADKACCLLLVS